jgi:predicted amidophosphoribosyltransferase
VKINPQEIFGCWLKGYALDQHSLKSEYIGDNEHGHPQFETTRSEIGEALFKLKYRNDHSVVDEISNAAVEHLEKWKPNFNLLIPATPSKIRAKQPVFLIAEKIAKKMGVNFSTDIVTRREALPELKNLSHEERTNLLKNAHDVQKSMAAGKRVLIVDDLFQSGSTMNAMCEVLRQAGCTEVFALTITKAKG